MGNLGVDAEPGHSHENEHDQGRGHQVVQLLLAGLLDDAHRASRQVELPGAAVDAGERPGVQGVQQLPAGAGDEIDELLVEGLAGRERDDLGHRPHRLLLVATAILGQRAHHGCGVAHRLVEHLLGYLAVADRQHWYQHRMGGAGVGTGRHRRHIGGEQEEEPGRCSPGSRRCDVNRHRDRAGGDGAQDVAGGVDDTAGSVELEDHQLGLGSRRLGQPPLDVAL